MIRWIRSDPGVRIGLLVGVVAAALLLAAIRVKSINLRYRHAQARETEEQLLERKQQLTVEWGRQRDPVSLQKRARDLGFRPPERVIELEAASHP